jgi:hypothetical protein
VNKTLCPADALVGATEHLPLTILSSDCCDIFHYFHDFLLFLAAIVLLFRAQRYDSNWSEFLFMIAPRYAGGPSASDRQLEFFGMPLTRVCQAPTDHRAPTIASSTRIQHCHAVSHRASYVYAARLLARVPLIGMAEARCDARMSNGSQILRTC